MHPLTSHLVQVAGSWASLLSLSIAVIGLSRAAIDLLASVFGIGVAFGATVTLALFLTFGCGVLIGALSLRYWQLQNENPI